MVLEIVWRVTRLHESVMLYHVRQCTYRPTWRQHSCGRISERRCDCVDLLMADMFLSMVYHRLPLPLIHQVKQSVHT